MITYFISFSHQNGFGNCAHCRSEKISSIEDIREIEQSFNENEGCREANILFFKILDDGSDES